MDKNAPLGRSCRHYDQLAIGDRSAQCCRIGHPIRKIVTAANGGQTVGILLMLPCKPGPERKAECPNYDPKTDAEVAASEAAMNAAMDRLVKALPLFNRLRGEMIAAKMDRQMIDCPFCAAAGAMHVSCAIGYNNHMHARCDACGEGFME